MKYYLVRMFNHEPELSWPLSYAGFVSLGFGDFIRDSETINSLRQNPTIDNLKKIANIEWGKSPKTLYNLLRFFSIQPKDWVIVPFWGCFYIAEVLESWKPLSEYEKELSEVRGKIKKEFNQYDIGFVLKVNWLKRDDGKDEITRNEFADKALTARLKARQTCLDISDLEKSIQTAWKRFNDKTPMKNPSIYLLEEASKNLFEVLTKPDSPFSPQKFETLIEELMKKMGANSVERPKVTGEGDADIMATFEPLKHIVYIQAKYFEKDSNASNWAVIQINDFSNRQEIASIEEYSTSFWAISSAKDYSDEAKTLAKKENIRLISGMELSALLLQVGLGNVL